MKLEEIRRRLSVKRGKITDCGNEAAADVDSHSLEKSNKCCNPWCAKSVAYGEKLCGLCKIYPARWPEPQSRVPFRSCTHASCNNTAGFYDPATGNFHCKEHSEVGFHRVGYEKCLVEGCDNELGILSEGMERLRAKGYCLDHQYICDEVGCYNRVGLRGQRCAWCEMRLR